MFNPDILRADIVRCMGCGAAFRATPFDQACSHCASDRVEALRR